MGDDDSPYKLFQVKGSNFSMAPPKVVRLIKVLILINLASFILISVNFYNQYFNLNPVFVFENNPGGYVLAFLESATSLAIWQLKKWAAVTFLVLLVMNALINGPVIQAIFLYNGVYHQPILFIGFSAIFLNIIFLILWCIALKKEWQKFT